MKRSEGRKRLALRSINGKMRARFKPPRMVLNLTGYSPVKRDAWN